MHCSMISDVLPASSHSPTVKVRLNSVGQRLLARHHMLKVQLTIEEAGKTVFRNAITFKD